MGTGHPNSQPFLAVTLAAQTAMPHIATIELRPNDLALPRCRVGLTSFSNLERTGCTDVLPRDTPTERRVI
jgi:hypothetical protein